MKRILMTICLAWLPTCTVFSDVDFNREIRPILSKHCFACHGFDPSTREAELRLDNFEGATRDLGGSFALVPHQPKASEIVTRIYSDDADVLMPPPESGQPLTDAEKKLLRQWITEGGAYSAHWSFVAPTQKPLPTVKHSQWPKRPIDYFILKQMEAQDFAPAPQADPARLLRRVALDLTGLPPTSAAAARFLAEPSPENYEREVDRLLAAPAFGEHWARMWLDLARYADTKGYEKDRHRDIWRYRDWVIDALNQDMPYDQFTKEQLAGDLLPERTDDQILATAFHRNTMTNEEGGTDDEEFRVAAVKDRVDTTLQVWMGLTMGCAKCHSHKYDPISISDYYSFLAYFNQTQDRDTESPFHPTPTSEQAREIAAQQNIVTLASKELNVRPAEFDAKLSQWKQQFTETPLWQNLKLMESTSETDVVLKQQDDRIILATGNRPERDTWTLTFKLPALTDGKKYQSLRIEHFPKSIAGGDWADKNVAIRDMTVEQIQDAGTPKKITLTNPRATFSQRNWEVAKLINGDNSAGWALSPKFKDPQNCILDFSEPIAAGTIRITLEQQYGESLLLARSRFSVSPYPAEWLIAELEPNFQEIFWSLSDPQHSAKKKNYQTELAKLASLKKAVTRTPVMAELSAAQQRKTKINNRGNFLDLGAEVTPNVLETFGSFPDNTSPNRLGVAKWLMQPENPLTSRVMVNRIWSRIFGVGIVETEEDFGSQGLPPSHPELLDWLAVDFRERGWSIKTLLKTIVTSSTYQQSAVATPDHLARDPRNRLLARGPRFRLSAETVRDQALAISGLLTEQLGGKSVMPPQPGGVWKTTYSGDDWKNATGPDRYRRGLYTYLKRTSPYPAMTTFDAGSGEVCQVRRIRTNTPLQALVTLNDTAFLEAAGGLAQRMQQSSEDLKQQIMNGFTMALVRQPTPRETERLLDLYASLAIDTDASKSLLQASALTEGDPRLVAIANVLLNLDETLMK